MSTRDAPSIVRTTGIDRERATDARDAELRRLRETVDSLETELAETEERLATRDRELDRVRERLEARETALAETTAWAEFLGEELESQRERNAELQRERDREKRSRHRVVERYEALLAGDDSAAEPADDDGLLSRLRAALYRSVAPLSSM